MCKTYPEMDVLIPLGGGLISEKQEELLRQRYDQHAMEYATDELWFPEGPDGPSLPINSCMRADTVKDIEEEIVDAVFNCLVLLFKRQDIHEQVAKAVGQEYTMPDEVKQKDRKAERLLDFALLAWDRLEPFR